MTTKYAILNPNTGEYEYVNSHDECLDKAKELAWQFYLTHTHNSPVSQVDTDDTGTETWSIYNDNKRTKLGI